MLEIGDQPARRGEPRARELPEAVERRHAEQSPQPRLAAAAVEIRARRRTVASAAKPEVSAAIASAGLSRATSAPSRSASASITSKRPVEISAQAIATCPPASPIATHQFAARLSSNASSVSVPAVTTRTIARWTSALGAAALPGRLGGLDLVGDRDAVPRLDQPCEIALGRMRGHAAHRDAIAVMLAPRGQRDVEAGAATLASSKNSSKKSPIR